MMEKNNQELGILLQNEHFVIINKKANILTVPSRFSGTDKDLRPVLGHQLQSFLNKKVYPVHRLDYEVSGLVLFAVSAEFHKVANRWFEDHQVIKTYFALSSSSHEISLKKDEWREWKSFILRGKKRAYESKKGEKAITRVCYKGILERGDLKYHQWLLQPITGKGHQLRFEMSKHGHPLMGDALYGEIENYWEEGIALKAIQLDFKLIEKEERASFGLPEIFSINPF